MTCSVLFEDKILKIRTNGYSDKLMTNTLFVSHVRNTCNSHMPIFFFVRYRIYTFIYLFMYQHKALFFKNYMAKSLYSVQHQCAYTMCLILSSVLVMHATQLRLKQVREKQSDNMSILHIT